MIEVTEPSLGSLAGRRGGRVSSDSSWWRWVRLFRVFAVVVFGHHLVGSGFDLAYGADELEVWRGIEVARSLLLVLLLLLGVLLLRRRLGVPSHHMLVGVVRALRSFLQNPKSRRRD